MTLLLLKMHASGSDVVAVVTVVGISGISCVLAVVC